MSEMTGLERLRALGREQEERSWSTVGKVRGRLMLQIAEQIEDERLREQLAVERVASEMELHCLGVEGMDDSPVARWARELREALDAGRDPADERDAIAWVREHGGIAYVKDAWNVRRNLDRQLEKAQAKVERQQRHIESIQSKLSERREHIENIANDVRNQCLAFGVDVSECDDEFDMLHDLNEALSKRLMPVGMEWPVFEDGEPVRVGDEFMGRDGKTYTVKQIRFMGYYFSLYDFCGEKPQFKADYGEHVKRPAPKVLAADGEPLEAGQTVYAKNYGYVKCTVLAIEWVVDGHLVEVENEGGHKFRQTPDEFTHQRPVLDANGVPIKVGDTVYDKDTGDRFEVDGFSHDGVVCTDIDACESDLEILPSQLTHHAPVLAADGKPLREGETVRGIGRMQHEYVVLGQPGLGGGTGRFKVVCHDVTDDIDCDCDPSLLIHERPAFKCRDCAHWQKDPTADNMGVCWFLYHEYEGQDCYAARLGDIGACEEFMPRAKALAERDA